MNQDMAEWERVLSAAARLQHQFPEAVLVGETASAIHAGHRISQDADHVFLDLRERFDKLLADLEEQSGWRTARVQRPVQILGRLDGIETGIRQLIRSQPLETTHVDWNDEKITIPTLPEMMRIKAVLILRRNATRDYLDFAAMADKLGQESVQDALRPLDALYPQPNGESALQQLFIQLGNAMPYDLEGNDLSEYKAVRAPWTDWQYVQKACAQVASNMFSGYRQDPSGEAFGPGGT